MAVEIVGFWTRDISPARSKRFRSISDRVAWILCIDDTLALAEDELRPWPILRFRRRIDATPLAALARQHLR